MPSSPDSNQVISITKANLDTLVTTTAIQPNKNYLVTDDSNKYLVIGLTNKEYHKVGNIVSDNNLSDVLSATTSLNNLISGHTGNISFANSADKIITIASNSAGAGKVLIIKGGDSSYNTTNSSIAAQVIIRSGATGYTGIGTIDFEVIRTNATTGNLNTTYDKVLRLLNDKIMPLVPFNFNTIQLIADGGAVVLSDMNNTAGTANSYCMKISGNKVIDVGINTSNALLLGFFGATPVVKQSPTDLATLLTALRNYGLIV